MHQSRGGWWSLPVAMQMCRCRSRYACRAASQLRTARRGASAAPGWGAGTRALRVIVRHCGGEVIRGRQPADGDPRRLQGARAAGHQEGLVVSAAGISCSSTSRALLASLDLSDSDAGDLELLRRSDSEGPPPVSNNTKVRVVRMYQNSCHVALVRFVSTSRSASSLMTRVMMTQTSPQRGLLGGDDNPRRGSMWHSIDPKAPPKGATRGRRQPTKGLDVAFDR